MKKYFKCLLVGLLLISLFPRNANAQISDYATLRITNQELALENAEKIEEIVYNREDLKSLYAGVYLNEDGNLVVNYIGSENVFKNQVPTTNTLYRQVNNSLESLEETQKTYQDMLGEYGIQAVELSIKNNSVIVTYDSEAEVSYLNTLDLDDNVQFQSATTDMVTQFTTDVINGNAGGITSGNAGKSFTIGCRAKNSSNNVGVLVPGHLFAGSGTKIYYNGGSTAMGTVKVSQCAGNVDATFVQTNSSFTPTLKFADGDSYEYTSVDTGIYGLREGLAVSLHGWKSGKTYGEVLSTSYSEVVGGIKMTNMVKCDYVAIGGDSGAAVTYDRYISSASSKVSVMGLQSFSLLSTNNTWITGKSYSCFSRIDYIFNTLGLSDY